VATIFFKKKEKEKLTIKYYGFQLCALRVLCDRVPRQAKDKNMLPK